MRPANIEAFCKETNSKMSCTVDLDNVDIEPKVGNYLSISVGKDGKNDGVYLITSITNELVFPEIENALDRAIRIMEEADGHCS